jgi:starch synthase (maltosyl-transferring)
MGIGDDEPYVVHDLLTGARYPWRGARNYVRLDPAERPGHLFLVERKMVSSTLSHPRSA